MNRKEVLQCLTTIKVAYPTSFRNMEQADANALVELWLRQFNGCSYDIVAKAIDSIISTDTSDFMPSIGKIKEMMIKLTEPEILTEHEAWNLVSKALRNSIYNAKAEFDKLPYEVQTIVGNHQQLREWSMMDSERVNSVISSNFMRSYRARSKSTKETLSLPAEVRQMLTEGKGNLLLGG